MALYEYRCRRCGYTCERFRSVEQRDYRQLYCACGLRNEPVQMERLISVPALRGATVAKT